MSNKSEKVAGCYKFHVSEFFLLLNDESLLNWTGTN